MRRKPPRPFVSSGAYSSELVLNGASVGATRDPDGWFLARVTGAVTGGYTFVEQWVNASGTVADKSEGRANSSSDPAVAVNGATPATGDKVLIRRAPGGAGGWWELSPIGGSGSASPLTTKGDVYTRTASADARLPVGANGLVLTTDSSTSTGLKWAAGVTAGGGSASGSYVAFSADNTYYDSGGGETLPAAGSYIVTLCASVFGRFVGIAPGYIDVILRNATTNTDIGLSRRFTVESAGLFTEGQVVITAKVTVAGATVIRARGQRVGGGSTGWTDAGFYSFSGSPIMITWIAVA